MEDKICINCNTSKSIDSYSFIKRSGKHDNTCKPCKNARRKEQRQNPEIKEKERMARKEYRSKPDVKEMKKQKDAEYRNKPENKQHMREYYAEYYAKNKESILKKNYENEKKRLEQNVEAYLRKVLRSRLNSAVKGTSKKDTTMNLLGCDANYLKKWLEHQFEPTMTWENYGIHWHIDHVIPCASFDLSIEENQKICFNWKNLRPAEKTENMSKSDKIDEILILGMKDLAEEYLLTNPLC